MDLNVIFSSFWGQFAVVAVIVALLAFIYRSFPQSGRLSKANEITICAALIAAACAINNFLPHFQMPQGGSVTLCSMLVIFLPAYLFGPKIGIMAGAVYGMLDFFINPYIVAPMQALLDYPIAFGAIGIGGILRDKKYGCYTGFALGVLGRFVASTASGAIFFASSAPAGQSPILFSALYNGTYMVIELIAGLAVLMAPQLKTTLAKIRI